MLNYTLILLVVVLLFLAYKHKEGMSDEKSINPGGMNITVPITLQVDKTPQSYQAFATTIKDYCSYYSSGNNINTAINLLGRDVSFNATIDKCYNTYASTDTASLNKCYSTALNAYQPATSQTNPTEYIEPCLVNYSKTDERQPLNYANNKSSPGISGWGKINYFTTRECSAYNSLKQIDDALDAGQKMVMSKIPECANALIL